MVAVADPSAFTERSARTELATNSIGVFTFCNVLPYSRNRSEFRIVRSTRRIFPRLQGRRNRQSWARFHMLEDASKSQIIRDVMFAFVAMAALFLTSCGGKASPNTLVMIIESSPTNLDPRVGIDAFSERIDELIFDDLLERDEHLNVKPGLAESWEIPDPIRLSAFAGASE